MNMMRLSTLSICTFIALAALGCSKDSPTNGGGIEGTFELIFGSDVSEEEFGLVSSDGGSVILAGRQGPFGSDSRAHVQKVSDQGSVLWERAFGSSGNYRIFGIAAAANGDVVAVGTYQPPSPFDFSYYAVRVSSSGARIWEHVYGSGKVDEAHGCAATDDGGFIIAGNASDLFGASAIMVIKVDGNGDSLWTQTYHSSDVDFCSDIIRSDDGGFIIVGQSAPIAPNGQDVLVMKIDSLGNEVWSHVFGGAGIEDGTSAGILSDGRIVAAGWTESFGAGARDGYVLVLSSSGDLLNQFTVGGPEQDAINGLAIDSDDGIVLCGDTGPSAGYDKNLYLLKVTTDGVVEWQRVYGGEGTDRGRDVIVTDDAIFACGIAGEKNIRIECCSKFYVIKTDLLGRL